MHPISLGEMKSVQLMNRIDTKYLLTENQLCVVLDCIAQGYFVQEIDGKRAAIYRTIYYDTQDLAMYMLHHNRKLNRDKVRMRSYVDSGLFFCEVKHKSNSGRTKKDRIAINHSEFDNLNFDSVVPLFLSQHQPYEVTSLNPNLETLFDRITLVNVDKTERLTIDCNLRFNNIVNGRKASLGQLVVMELKQDGRTHSMLKDVLFQLRIQPFKISKYCIGTCLTRPDVKQNRFKNKLRRIEKMEKLSETKK